MAKAITIDGPAGSGKSTTARRVAQKSGINYVDTGLFYRSIGAGIRIEMLRHPRDVSPEDLSAWAKENYHRIGQLGQVALLDGEDITALCRDADSGSAASMVANLPLVRAITNDWTATTVRDDLNRYVLTEGRDEARLHARAGHFVLGFYTTASNELRALRRFEENIRRALESGKPVPTTTAHDELSEIMERDARDMLRGDDPLSPMYGDMFRFIGSEADLPTPTNGWQLGIETGAFQNKEDAQDELMMAGIDRLAV